MAQLNPNFEIDFSDINSYEQIQLINDTRLAKENLLLQRAYKEPSDHELIRNHFSAFTFVDFCPRIFAGPGCEPGPAAGAASGSQPSAGRHLVKHYELESFSDLFERINAWLRLHRDWRVVSMETLVFDCSSQFNHLKSAVHARHLPRNTRGLRLFLSPSKSRFAAHQKIGCINVVPRRLSGRNQQPEAPAAYENLDDILRRLNELLLSRPIEGRILSVETITLPMVDGYVNTESTYFMDSRLNLLHECTYNLAQTTPGEPVAAGSSGHQRAHNLIDILRVYYEFGPVVCGLVNLIDFVPRFYSPTPTDPTPSGGCASSPDSVDQSGVYAPAASPDEGQPPGLARPQMRRVVASEQLTKLARRSLTWFEAERKRVLAETCAGSDCPGANTPPEPGSSGSLPTHSCQKGVNLKVCNLQVHTKTLLKYQLLEMEPERASQTIDSRRMIHECVKLRTSLDCHQCHISTAITQVHNWCSHLVELCQPINVKFVRLAYVVPVSARRSLNLLRYPSRLHEKRHDSCHISNMSDSASITSTTSSSSSSSSTTSSASNLLSSSTSSTSSSASHPFATSTRSSQPSLGAAESLFLVGNQDDLSAPLEDEPKASLSAGQPELATTRSTPTPNSSRPKSRRSNRGPSRPAPEPGLLNRHDVRRILQTTNERHRAVEQEHQLTRNDDVLFKTPIGQLTYRLFAPCQLVNSSSCFAINPMNSSSPLARRGSVDLNGGGISSENASPSTLLLGSSSACPTPDVQQMVSSFGAFFPAVSHEVLASTNSVEGASSSRTLAGSGGNATGKFTINEFEPISAIRRRMEVYVTTNPMKVIAGETLTVNLSDNLSCLSTAIEQTLVKAPFAQHQPTTWVSVYILYAAVDEPNLPAQLLAQHKESKSTLGQINEETTSPEAVAAAAVAAAAASCSSSGNIGGADNTECIFDDEFRCPKEFADGKGSQKVLDPPAPRLVEEQHVGSLKLQAPIEEIAEHALPPKMYNPAYDRTVALPIPPDNHHGRLDPIEYLGSRMDYMWLNESDLIELRDEEKRYVDIGSRKRKKRKPKSRQDDSQCSIM